MPKEVPCLLCVLWVQPKTCAGEWAQDLVHSRWGRVRGGFAARDPSCEAGIRAVTASGICKQTSCYTPPFSSLPLFFTTPVNPTTCHSLAGPGKPLFVLIQD